MYIFGMEMSHAFLISDFTNNAFFFFFFEKMTKNPFGQKFLRQTEKKKCFKNAKIA